MLFREQGGQYRKSMSREITIFFGEEETGGNHFLKLFDSIYVHMKHFYQL